MKAVLSLIEGRQALGFENRLFGELPFLPSLGSKLLLITDPVQGEYLETSPITSVEKLEDGSYIIKTNNSLYSLVLK